MKVVGKVKDAHGIKGEIKILIFSGDFSWTDGLESFQIESPKGEKKTLTITKLRETPEFLIVSCPEIKDRNQAESYKGWSFAVPDETFISEPGETIYLSEIQGFALVDKAGQSLGQITGFSSNNFQDLLQITKDDLVFEVPFIDEFIIDISFSTRTVTMDLPEGLFDPDLVGKAKP